MFGNLGLGHREVVHDRPDGLLALDERVQDVATTRLGNGIEDVRCGGRSGHAPPSYSDIDMSGRTLDRLPVANSSRSLRDPGRADHRYRIPIWVCVKPGQVESAASAVSTRVSTGRAWPSRSATGRPGLALDRRHRARSGGYLRLGRLRLSTGRWGSGSSGGLFGDTPNRLSYGEKKLRISSKPSTNAPPLGAYCQGRPVRPRPRRAAPGPC